MATNTRRHEKEQQCTQALSVDLPRSLAVSGVSCKPGCMPHGRNTKPNARRQEAYRRQREANEKAAAAARERAVALAANQRAAEGHNQIAAVWGGQQDALTRLRDISNQLEK